MKSIQEIMDGPIISDFTGSKTTHAMVATEIEKRWGKEEVKKYDPYKNTLTFKKWLSLNYVPRKGEHAIRSLTFCEIKNPDGTVAKRIKRPCFLFYYRQVTPVEKSTV